jgi:uncharacterized protein YodC (DUF2158 family)
MSFKIGDVVRLRSGGPNMTVTGTSEGPDRPVLFNCTWIDKDHRPQYGAFPADALVPANVAKEPKVLPDMANTRRGGGTPWSA